MSKRILIIDDEPDIRETTQICLEIAKGWEVFTAGSCQEGLEKAIAEQPDAILLDVMMPDVDGLTTFAEIQANPATRQIPVILLTAMIQPSDQRRYNQMAIAGVITKPYDPTTLADQIIELLN
jgi:CheY-like chemotaxis protein